MAASTVALTGLAVATVAVGCRMSGTSALLMVHITRRDELCFYRGEAADGEIIPIYRRWHPMMEGFSGLCFSRF